MEQLDQVITLIALSMGVGWASGINLYAAILMLGLMSNMGHMALPPGLELVADPMVLIAAGFMYCVEFFADKVPGVDTGWDTLHTFIRIPAGAVLAAGAMGDVNGAAMLAAGLVGGTMAATSHTLKAGSRVLINTSPEPLSNWLASFSEDILVIAGLWTALTQPVFFLVALLVFILFAVWLLPKIWTGIKKVFRWIFPEDKKEQIAPKSLLEN
ncbi:DUF4126 domain-containing protein [Aliamphritea ceti]|uniref:DUF4126 domain-containing protein n=1 Tax=Aliamphritea ceti TaxID=1524258 RepID=UPI0021C35A9C|nr:DUF4126 domain-containing protein [Aliamphritea ceti]